MSSMVGQTCLICGKKPSIYEKVRHCKECHSEYCKENTVMHRRKNNNEHTTNKGLAS